jgi:hypothetical protein
MSNSDSLVVLNLKVSGIGSSTLAVSFFSGDRVPFSTYDASDSGSLQNYTNQSQSLFYFGAKKTYTSQ